MSVTLPAYCSRHLFSALFILKLLIQPREMINVAIFKHRQFGGIMSKKNTVKVRDEDIFDFNEMSYEDSYDDVG
jgi:hypothetical protein